MNPAALAAALSGDIGNSIAGSTPGGIARQEAAGHIAFVASDALPKEHHLTRDQLVGLGFVFGNDIDELFVGCRLPEGWKRVTTDHSMYTDIVDERGRKRAAVFYKAAFYDRKADVTFHRRFGIYTFERGTDDDHKRCVVKDGETTIFDAGERGRRDYELGTEHEAACKAWLDANRPQWRDPLAYWSE